jgi:two-component system response regulator AtoC
MDRPRILVVDDEKLIRWFLEKNLTQAGYHVVVAKNAEEALSKIKSHPPHAVILDNNMPGRSGLDILPEIKIYDPAIAVLLMTGHAAPDLTIQALKLGAYQCLNKPLVFDEINLILRSALEKASQQRQIRGFKSHVQQRYAFENIIGQSPATKALTALVKTIAHSEASTVLIQGERGTGKELMARIIHFQSRCAYAPFLTINCSLLPHHSFEIELFGQEGSHTNVDSLKTGQLELAAGGTVYFREIGDLDLDLQRKLLRVIEDRSFKRIGGTEDLMADVRIIAATRKDLKTAVQAGTFRQDLYYRLNVVPLQIKPLRQRREDIIPLAEYYLHQYDEEFGEHAQILSPDAGRALWEYYWPGNIRELRNVIEHAALLEIGDAITLDALPPHLLHKPAIDLSFELNIEIPEKGLPLEIVERHLLKKALEKSNHNQSKAARMLLISRDSLRHKMEKYDMR